MVAALVAGEVTWAAVVGADNSLALTGGRYVWSELQAIQAAAQGATLETVSLGWAANSLGVCNIEDFELDQY